MGVVIRKQKWLECVDVVIRWCCKEVYGFNHINYPYTPSVLVLFCSSIIYFFVYFSPVLL